MNFRALGFLIPLVGLFWLSGNAGIRASALGAVLLVVLSFLWSLVQYLSLRIRLEGSWDVLFPTEEAQQEVIFSNRGPLPLWVTVEDRVGNLDAVGPLLKHGFLGPWQESRWSYRVSGVLRGRHLMGPVIAEGHDPLGLFPWQKSWPQARSVLILPAVGRVKGIPEDGQSLGRMNARSLEQDPQAVRFVRAYEAGDEPRHLDQRTTALTGQLHTRVLGATRHYHTVLLVNLCAGDYPVRRRTAIFERLIHLTSSVAVHQMDRGVPVHASLLGYGGSALIPGSELLPFLAEANLSPQESTLEETFSQLPSVPSDLYYVGPPPPPHLSLHLKELERMGYRLWIFLVGLSCVSWDNPPFSQVFSGGDDGPISFQRP